MLAASQADALQMLAAGYYVREARAELGIVGTARREAMSGVEALLASPSVFFPRGASELQEALNRPLDLWRIFLHPSQRRIAYRETYSGPVRVTGGAGTGKTVVAVHRAHYLAGRLPAGSTRPVLVTTFVRTLADNLRSSLGSLAGSYGYGNIEVTTVDALARRIVRQAEGREPKVLADNDRIAMLWDVAAAGLLAPLTGAALRQEWEQVILAQGLRSEAEYLGAPRPGRGLRLTRAQRLMVWQALGRFLENREKTGERTFYQLADDAARYLSQAPTAELFAHVIVDEAQDLHPVQWRLLRAAVPDGPNDLFVVGDAHQRIYDHRVSLSSLGINVRGRSHRLNLNYRTTEEILRWAVGLLRGQMVDDMDAGVDTLDGYRSAFRGSAPPVLTGYASHDAEMEGLVVTVRGWIDRGVDPAAIGVAARMKKSVLAAISTLRDAGLDACDLERKSRGGVEVGTMHRMKGLEYRAMAVIDVSAASVPLRWAVTPVDADPKAHEQDTLRERCLLYVACTRARELLTVSWSGHASPFLSPFLS